MKLVKFTVAVAICGLLCSSSALADELRHPQYAWTVAADSGYYAIFDDEEAGDEVSDSPSDAPVEDEAASQEHISSPSDIPIVEEPLVPIVAPDKEFEVSKEPTGGKGCGKGSGKGCGCGAGLCITGDAVSIWDKLTPCREGPLDIGGWVQAGFYNYNTGMFNNYHNNLNLNQAWLYAEKALDTSCGWDWGFRADYVYGTDGPDTQAFGNPPDTWDFGWTNGNYYGHAIPQLYGEVGYNDLSVKVGHFYTICGYEVVTAPDNFFYSHAFTMYYAEPFTHSGVLATYEVGDNLTVYGGWTKGWDTGYEAFGGDVFLGGVSVGLGENVTATYTTTFGNIGFGTDASGYSHSIVVDMQLTDRLNYVFQSDFVDYRGAVTDIRTGFPIGTPALSHRYGINNYLFYTINDCLAAGVRFEWFNVEQTMAARSDLYEFTFGVNYKPHPNFILRPEIRWDQDDDGFTVLGARNDTLGFGMDMILTF